MCTSVLAYLLRRHFWLGAIVLFMSVFGLPHDADAVREISAKRECAICHIMWLTDFKREDVTPLIPYDPKPVTDSGKQDVSSTERMCFSCHDGFVLDSRFAWRDRRHDHPVGIKPSAKMRIPTSQGKTVFPLNDDGKVYCGTCHTAHGVDWDQKESPVFMRVKNVDSSLCLACHLDRGTGPAEGNHPVFQSPAKFPSALFRAGSHFGRDGAVICQTCHRAHGAGAKKMLVLGNEEARLCRTCHTDKDGIRRTKHDLTIMAPQARNALGQTPDESGPCGVCHVSHNAKGPALWARERVTGSDPTAAACLGCHSPEGMAKEKTVGEHSHPINKAVSEVGITATAKGWASRFPRADKDQALQPLPLYDSHGLHVESGGRVGCGSCHDPHVWSPAPGPAKADDPRKIEGGGRDSFLRIAMDADSRLCTNCHVDKGALALSPHNLSISAPAETNANKQKVADSGVCGACHAPHNGLSEYIWARQTGSGTGTVEKLCSECHRQGGVAEKKLTGRDSHPIGIDPQHKPVRLPLFSNSGHKAADGKIDCATCHNSHQWDPQNIASRTGVKPKADGDANTSFLRLPAGGSSELCVECHESQRWVSKTEHDLSVTAPADKNAKSQNVRESGVCGQCHTPHSATDSLRLWARRPGEGPDQMERLCRSCHAEGQVAAAKRPPESRHPAKVTVWSQKVRGRFRKTAADIPVFDPRGESEHAGVITCTSCHDPHQWVPHKQAEGPGKNTEGDVRSSFLRLTNSEAFVCADCHGLDSLFRYKYFHGRTSRKPYPLFR